MPFTKLSKGMYISPSGKIWTKAQVEAYHATKGFTMDEDCQAYHMCDCGHAMAFDGEMRCAECGAPTDVRKLSAFPRKKQIAPFKSTLKVHVPPEPTGEDPAEPADGDPGEGVAFWEEEQHPRDDHGQFTSGDGGNDADYEAGRRGVSRNVPRGEHETDQPAKPTDKDSLAALMRLFKGAKK